MKVGYLVLCHKNPQLVSDIVCKLLSDNTSFAIIHVDKSEPIEEFKKVIFPSKRIIFVSRRINVNWGGFSAIEAIIEMMRVGLENDCDRYVLIQGQDFPLQTNVKINDFFGKYSDTEFLKSYCVTSSSRKTSFMKTYGYYNMDWKNQGSIKRAVAKMLMFINKFGIKYRRGYFYDRFKGKRFDIYWGWGHFALTKSCVKYIVNFYNNNPGFNRYMSTLFPVDELYFSTVINNSEFKNKVLDGGPVDESKHLEVRSMLNLTYFEYPDEVRIFNDPDEVGAKIKKQYLFIRKIDDAYIKQSNMKGL